MVAAAGALEMTGGQRVGLQGLARSHKKRRRWHLHFTPTSSSWLNLVECWFSVLSRKALTNTGFTSVAELETRIDCWVSHWNDNPEPFVWTKLADEILDKVARGQATLDPDHQIRDTPLGYGFPHSQRQGQSQ